MGSNDSNHDKGKNLGQGLANITDQQRRDLAGSGDRAPTQDQAGRLTSGERGVNREAHHAGKRESPQDD